ncbi:unnamed protein product [Kuraishia capsulata CBS 1993]|uniref:Transcription initiation factor TFIID subunit 4 n=1 Tax=Kuraishia capsulata CBS 1993 TaxID=1382522 RepID=W6MKN5_9ASCO|nr:uncharacterized protein KUCA_T00002545001 [Kuraishia capsulata CBS 1993]CDK26573.1 unnamed protein product [Kuraishia capsulata CBS 1993]
MSESGKRSSDSPEDPFAKRMKFDDLDLRIPSPIMTPSADPQTIRSMGSGASTPIPSSRPTPIPTSTHPSVSAAGTPQPVAATMAIPQSQQQTGLATQQPQTRPETNSDPDKLSDAIAAAGVDLKDEENRLSSTLQHQRRTNVSSLLHPTHLTIFMNKVLAQHGVRQQGLEYDTELLQLMSAACENFVSSIVTDSIILSRHRRRPIKSKKVQGTAPRSDVSKALRDMATRQKDSEEKRAQRRIALGVDASGEDVKKVGAEETLHRAANATAAMMTAGKKKKKYSWMSAEADAPKSNSVLARGDNGIRYREAREEKEVVLRDLLAAMESRRVGVDKALVKGYAKLKD